MKTLLFIGECRSLTAQRKGWTWEDGRLAAKPLFDALDAMGVNPHLHAYRNLWLDARDNLGRPVLDCHTINTARACCDGGHVVVALGKRVSDQLTKCHIDHVALVHPAARGAIRKRERYHAHVKERIGAALAGGRRRRLQRAAEAVRAVRR